MYKNKGFFKERKKLLCLEEFERQSDENQLVF